MARGNLLCISCNNKLTLWGKTKSGKKRWFCKSCKTTRTYHKRKKSNIFGLFRQYVLWGLTYEMLSSISGYSIQHLIYEFHKLLRLDPPSLPKFDQSGFEVTYLLIDGLWFGRWFVLMVYRQSGNLRLLHISIAGREASGRIIKDLLVLKNVLRYRFAGAVTDGGTGITRALNYVYPHIPHQICMAHMHRDIVNAIGRYPKDDRTKELKYLADLIWLIGNKEELDWWKKEVKNWFYQNLTFIRETHKDETGRIWYVHKGVRKAIRILLRLHKISFTYLDHKDMPKTTNELEASFGHLGQRWVRHKGLKRERWESFLKWFTYFYNKEKADNITKKDKKNNTIT